MFSLGIVGYAMDYHDSEFQLVDWEFGIFQAGDALDELRSETRKGAVGQYRF